MERFKACEKEMKTKAYSKEGLTNSAKLDPKEKEREATKNFISSMIEELDRQVENVEAEQETTQNSMKRGKKDTQKMERINELEEILDRHRWHLSKLELILRMLENGNLSPDIVNNIQDDIRYYVESNADPDFAEDEEIYDELNLDDDEDNFDLDQKQEEVPGHSLEDLAVDHEKEKDTPLELAIDATPGSALSALLKSASSSSHASHSTSSAGSASGKSAITNVAASAAPSSSGNPSSSHKPEPLSRKSTLTSSTPTASTSSSVSPISQNASAAIPSATTGGSLKPAPQPVRSTNELKYASAAAAANAQSSNPNIPQGLSPLPPPSAQMLQQTAELSSASGATPPGLTSSPATMHVLPAAVKAPWAEKASSADKQDSSNDSAHTQAFVNKASKKDEQAKDVKTPSTKVKEASVTSTPKVTLPPGLQDLIHSFDAAKERIGTPPPITSISKLVESSFLNAPDSISEMTLPRHYYPQNPYPTQPFYPQEPLQSFASPVTFSKMELETLFFIFYYKQGTYHQYLAAKELKNRSWRYHKQLMTWFQRYEEPKTINNEFEQGTYRFFDFEGAWGQRRRPNFTFEYQFLEDETV